MRKASTCRYHTQALICRCDMQPWTVKAYCLLAGLEDVEAVAVKDAVLAQSLLPYHAIGPLPLIQTVPCEGTQV